MIAPIIAFLVLLPCSTWLLGSVLGLLDDPDRAAALRRVAWRGLPFLAAGLLLGTRAAWPAAAALATALIVHTVVSAGLRAAMARGWLTTSATDSADESSRVD